jgi:hypothetical protein
LFTEQALCNLDAAVWGRPEIEGLRLFWKYEVKLQLIKNFVQVVETLLAVG